MHSSGVVLACLAGVSHARRLQAATKAVGENSEPDKIARNCVAELNDVELGVEGLRLTMGDASMLSQVAAGLRSVEGREELSKLMANPSSQKQAKQVGGLQTMVINLADRTERMRRFDDGASRAGLVYERFSAVDTRDASRLAAHADRIESSAYESLLASMHRGYRHGHADLTPGAVGCALSHRAVSRSAVRRGLPLLAVFEDDAEVPHDVLALISEAVEAAPPHWHCILLGWSGAPPAEEHSLLQRVERFCGLHAYVLSAAGAMEMVARNSPVATHADHAMSLGAQRGELNIFGVRAQERRIRQQCKGSDVQLPMRPISRVK